MTLVCIKLIISFIPQPLPIRLKAPKAFRLHLRYQGPVLLVPPRAWPSTPCSV